ncbi:MAG: hypothetical protein KatS3mg114_1408 [Planctomycetaceae bacterium]|nr:MAG: hypothetical protein KatS3mg114_1408 [Planctomycetaceae bacterium]
MARGDHLTVPLYGLLTHHGIDVGDGTVVHWWVPTKKRTETLQTLEGQTARICRTSLEEFCQGQAPQIRHTVPCFPPAEIVQRALSRLGEAGYDVFTNNCEHFALWCRTGVHRSAQVDAVERHLVGSGVKEAAKTALKCCVRSSTRMGVKSLAEVATPWLFVADALQMTTELMVMNQGQADETEAVWIGRSVGCLSSVLMGGAVGGPVGAVASFCLWGLGEMVGEVCTSSKS